MVKNFLFYPLLFFLLIAGNACTPAQQDSFTATATLSVANPTVSVTSPRSCERTLDDGVSPSYKPDAPERNIVGKGHVVTGIVLSSVDCQPIPHTKLEFWPEEEGRGHPDSAHGTFYTDENGHYRFECNMPDHIHMRISAPGYRTIGINSYHPEEKAEGVFDIVLEPEK